MKLPQNQIFEIRILKILNGSSCSLIHPVTTLCFYTDYTKFYFLLWTSTCVPSLLPQPPSQHLLPNPQVLQSPHNQDIWFPAIPAPHAYPNCSFFPWFLPASWTGHSSSVSSGTHSLISCWKHNTSWETAARISPLHLV